MIITNEPDLHQWQLKEPKPSMPPLQRDVVHFEQVDLRPPYRRRQWFPPKISFSPFPFHYTVANFVDIEAFDDLIEASVEIVEELDNLYEAFSPGKLSKW